MKIVSFQGLMSMGSLRISAFLSHTSLSSSFGGPGRRPPFGPEVFAIETTSVDSTSNTSSIGVSRTVSGLDLVVLEGWDSWEGGR
jgi:hypothetical protein